MKQLLAKPKRFRLQLAPTSSAWINAVERFFADLTEGSSASRSRHIWPSGPSIRGRSDGGRTGKRS